MVTRIHHLIENAYSHADHVVHIDGELVKGAVAYLRGVSVTEHQVDYLNPRSKRILDKRYLLTQLKQRKRLCLNIQIIIEKIKHEGSIDVAIVLLVVAKNLYLASSLEQLLIRKSVISPDDVVKLQEQGTLLAAEIYSLSERIRHVNAA